ncbi:MAG: class I SAM-dependent methyltransferase [Thermodesulfobacteriota bacterium]
MSNLDAQIEYWDTAAASKTFTHPIPLPVFRALLPPTAKILDYGCGYGRTCSQLREAGYHNVIGIDISEEMIKRGRLLNDHLDLRVFDGRSTDFEDSSFDACILLAVLTCIPLNDGQNRTMAEIHRLLRPGGIVFVSDYPMQTDARNQKRYQKFRKEFDIFGIFRTESAVVRHFDMRRIYQLLADFDISWQDSIRVCTMNGNESDVFQIAARKRI